MRSSILSTLTAARVTEGLGSLGQPAETCDGWDQYPDEKLIYEFTSEANQLKRQILICSQAIPRIRAYYCMCLLITNPWAGFIVSSGCEFKTTNKVLFPDGSKLWKCRMTLAVCFHEISSNNHAKFHQFSTTNSRVANDKAVQDGIFRFTWDAWSSYNPACQ